MNKEKILKENYNFIINHFSNEKYNLVLQIFKQIYATDRRLLHKKQFAQCTLQNRILIKLLIGAGFKKSDISIGWGPFWGIHQYLIVRAGKKRFLVDPFLGKFEKIKN